MLLVGDLFQRICFFLAKNVVHVYTPLLLLPHLPLCPSKIQSPVWYNLHKIQQQFHSTPQCASTKTLRGCHSLWESQGLLLFYSINRKPLANSKAWETFTLTVHLGAKLLNFFAFFHSLMLIQSSALINFFLQLTFSSSHATYLNFKWSIIGNIWINFLWSPEYYQKRNCYNELTL